MWFHWLFIRFKSPNSPELIVNLFTDLWFEVSHDDENQQNHQISIDKYIECPMQNEIRDGGLGFAKSDSNAKIGCLRYFPFPTTHVTLGDRH
jgi:hypothetical protein